MSDKTKHQISRFLQKLAEKYPQMETPEVFTDVHIRVSQESGDVMAFDDDDREITRVVVDEWIDAPKKTKKFFSEVAAAFRPVIEQLEQEAKSQPSELSFLGIIQPYNYVLEDDNGEYVTELYVVDDTDTFILCSSFMKDLDKDLDKFIDDLLEKD